MSAFEATDTPFDEVPPVVLGVELLETTQEVFAISVTFNEALLDPAGHSGADDVTNPANYQLFNAGNDGLIYTTVCGVAQGDDAPITVDSVIYNDLFFEAMLAINNSLNLPNGPCRLLACGSTTLRDSDNNPLDGNRDGTGGDDYKILFQLVPPPPSELFVNTTEDVHDGKCDVDHCSLREAVSAVNIATEPAIIHIPAGTYTLTLSGSDTDSNLIGDLDVMNGTTIIGAGAESTIIDANQIDRVFDIYATDRKSVV